MTKFKFGTERLFCSFDSLPTEAHIEIIHGVGKLRGSSTWSLRARVGGLPHGLVFWRMGRR